MSKLIAGTAGNVYKDLGANHHMWTSAQLWDNNSLTAVTRTQSGTWFGGYTGGVVVVATDAAGTVLAKSTLHSFGVNGTVFGGSDRTDGWNEILNPGQPLAGRAVALYPFQAWAPTWRLKEPLIQVGFLLYDVISAMASSG
ncbi:hypothetical protein [Arthrobacter sp. 2MCAF14]|uniref:hypothetical protein n=1 Tax=Arthrobacter sp. 2MCAF14 TaxID=3232982 RepID=UPI003F906659